MRYCNRRLATPLRVLATAEVVLFAFFVSKMIAAGSTWGLVVFGTVFAILIVGTAWVWMSAPNPENPEP